MSQDTGELEERREDWRGPLTWAVGAWDTEDHRFDKTGYSPPRRGERKGLSEKWNDSSTHFTNTITLKIYDILPKPQPKAHICQILFNIIQVQEEKRHWTASPLERMATEFDLHCWNAHCVLLCLLWLKFRNEMTVKLHVSASDTQPLVLWTVFVSKTFLFPEKLNSIFKQLKYKNANLV